MNDNDETPVTLGARAAPLLKRCAMTRKRDRVWSAESHLGVLPHKPVKGGKLIKATPLHTLDRRRIARARERRALAYDLILLAVAFGTIVYLLTLYLQGYRT